MPIINPNKVADILREVSASTIEPRFQALQKDEIHTKSGPNDFVTIADIEAEEKLTTILRDLLPGSYVVGEEAVSRGETSLDDLETESGAIWIIDPVDGTGNYARGEPVYGCIVALVQNNQTVMGWIYDIPNNRMGIGEQGSGAFINDNKQGYAAFDGDIKDQRGFISSKFLPTKMREALAPVLESEFGNTKPRMCCAHEYLDILDGTAGFSLYSRIRAWDHLAGAMMLKEAGGDVRKWDGSEHKPSDQRGGLICAPSEEIRNQIFDLLLKGYV